MSYLPSHPWITFALDLRAFKPDIWILLGAIQSKFEHLAGVPLLPNTAKELHLLSLARGVRATTAIEGNTLSQDQIEQLIKGELEVPRSKEYLKTEAQNIVDACNEIGEQILLADDEITPLTVEDILHYNALVLKDLKLDEGVIPGKIRTYSVIVGNYRGAPASDCHSLLEKLCAWLAQDWHTAMPWLNTCGIAVLKAILAQLYINWIHPFGDGNGRTARLVEFRLLLARGVPDIAAHLLSNHYNETRSEYYRQLAHSSAQGPDGVASFIQYALQGLADGLDEEIHQVQQDQLRVHWRELVFTSFSSSDSKVSKRRRDLILAISAKPEGIVASDAEGLTPALSAAYAKRSARTLARDLEELESMGLLVRTKEHLRANMEMALAFGARRRTGQIRS